ncbi:MAG TPA: hypothetical protein VHP12_07985, partial [Chitinophagaceae bacterium]|nr:hypothetical protein [Chitinophagaceae bacterium]
ISTMLVNNAFYSIQAQKDTARAIQYLQLAIASDSTNADAYSNLAKIRGDEKMMLRAKTMGFSRGYSQSFLRKQKECVNKQKKGIKPL